MVFKFWLILTEAGGVSVRKRDAGTLVEGDVAVPMTVRVPDAWFYRRAPVLEVIVPNPQFPSVAIEAEVGEVRESA